jgi:hypothetical protein
MKILKRVKVPILLIFLLLSTISVGIVFAANGIGFFSAEKKSNKTFNKSKDLYAKLNLNALGLTKDAYNFAVKGYDILNKSNAIQNGSILSIIDFSLPSSQKRLFVIDLLKEKLVFHTYVSHGRNSGSKYATQFSNTPESLQSSLGFYETSCTYEGKNGYSLQLIGLEKGINDKAFERAIVIHGASYVSEENIKAQGYIGRSWGCPAVPENVSENIINYIKDGTCLFIYAPDKKYMKQSRFING